jgi:steroid delta-isomerase-like uncharacterized protein
MTREDMKALARRFLDAFGANDQMVLKDVLDPDLLLHVAGGPSPIDRDTHLQGIQAFSAAFSGLRLTVEDQIAEDDRVVTRFTWQATHSGDFQGLSPTRKTVVIDAISIERIQDGRIVERWFNHDVFGLMQQLGVVPPPQPTR